MAILKPIVLNLPDRGTCAVDYIDYFDEGQYGPDKPFFVNRFDDLNGVAEQMRACLALQGNENSLIHNNRHYVEGKWISPLVSKDEPYPQRAQYAIRFMLRIKFYGEFAYLDIGKSWLGLDPTDTLYIEPSQLEVLNRCMLTQNDAEAILQMLLDTTIQDTGKKFSEIGKEKYEVNKENGETSIQVLSDSDAISIKLARQEHALYATYISDGETLYADNDGLISLD